MSTSRLRRTLAAAAIVAAAASSPLAWQTGTPPAGGQAPAGADVTAAQVAAAIDQLGTLEYKVRSAAGRTIRRAPAPVAVPRLTEAATRHADGYVRFRALVLLSGFNDPGTRDLMARLIADPNDRLRSVAYTWFERHPEPAIVPRLIEALGREESEFVRPALMRALAAQSADPAARKEVVALVMKGQAFFRSIAIEAIGDYRGAYALKAITDVAGIDGPLQDDAALAIGKIGDKASLPLLAKLQQSAPRQSQPAIAAAICLLGVNCESHEGYIVRSLAFAIANPGYQELLRGSANALAALGASGRESAVASLVEMGAPTRDPARAAIALAAGTVALRNAPLVLKVFERPGLLQPGAELLREAFDMLEEDFEEERFFVTVRRAYWQSADRPAARGVAEALIATLEF